MASHSWVGWAPGVRSYSPSPVEPKKPLTLTSGRSRRASLFASVALLAAPAAVHAQDVTVASGQTVTNTITITGPETITVDAGGTVDVAGTTAATAHAINMPGNPSGAFTVTNAGTITSVYGIGINISTTSTSSADIVTNSGMISSGFSGYGLAVLFGRGTNTLNITTGASFVGRVLDPTGTGTLNLSGAGSGVVYGESVDTSGNEGLSAPVAATHLAFVGWDGFSTLNINSGTWSLVGGGYYNAINVAAGAVFNVCGGLPSGAGCGAFVYNGANGTSSDGGLGPLNTTLTIVNNGTIDSFTAGQQIYYDPTNPKDFKISGTGTFVFQGAGTSYLSPTSSVAQSTVEIASGTLVNAGTITVANALQIDAGATFQLGSGGNLENLDGVVVDNGATGTINGNIVDNGVLDFALLSNYAYSGALTGGGQLIKDGSSTLTLGVATNFTGYVTLNNGTLVNQGTLASSGTTATTANAITLAAGSPGAAGTVAVNNSGTIQSAYGAAVDLYTSSNSAIQTVTNSGAISSGYNGYGIAVLFGAGTDTLNATTGASFVGRIIDPAGTGTLNLSGTGSGVVFGESVDANGNEGVSAVGSATSALPFVGWDGFSILNISSGTWTLVGGGYYNALNVASGAVFNICDLPSGVTCGSFVYNGANGKPSDGGLGALNTDLSIVNNGTINDYTDDKRIYYDPSNPKGFLLSGAGNFVFQGTGTSYLSPTSSAAQSAVEIASGTLVNAGTITVASALQIDAGGTFQLGSGGNLKNLNGVVVDNGTTGTINGNIVDNGNFVVALPTSYTITGAFSGNGALIDNDPGVLTFSGPYSFTGSTTINGGGSIDIAQLANITSINLTSGVLNLAGDATIGTLIGTGGVVNVATGATLTVGSGYFSGSLGGGGSLIKSGTGTFDVAGTDTLSGSTVVEAGDLQVDGSLASPVTVDSGATLGGAGTITGAVTVASGGVFSPGDPVTTNVIGSVTFASGSSYFAQVTAAGAHDLIAVTGAVTIQHGASVEVDPLGLATAYSRVTSYTIITATNGVSGTFSKVTSDAPLLTPLLAYTADAVQLSLVRNDISFASLAATRNQAAAAGAIQAGGAGSALYSAVVLQTTAGLQQSFDALSGELFASLPTILLSQSDQTRRTLSERMETAAGTQGVWGEALGDWASFSGSPGVAGASSRVGGLTFGLDGAAAGWRLGVAVSYEQDSIDDAARMSSATDTAEAISVYAGRDFGRLAVRLGASYGWHRIDSSRSEQFPGFSDRTTAGFDAGTDQAFGEVGYIWAVHGASVEPFAGVSYDQITTQSAKEAGGVAALAVAGVTKDEVSTRLGARTSADVGTANGLDLSLHGSLAWRHAEGAFASNTPVSFEATGQDFVVNGLPLAHDAAEIVAGLSAKFGGRGRLDLSYSGEFSSRQQDNGLKLLASWAF